MTDISIENLQAKASKLEDGTWCAIAFINGAEQILIVAINHGKKCKPTLKKCMANAIERIQSGHTTPVPTAFNGETWERIH